MMAKEPGSKCRSLLRSVEERALSKKVEEKQVPYLPKDCFSNILVRLPIESLPSSRLVCKPWYKLINSPIFIDAHLRRSEVVLIFLTPIVKQETYLDPFSTRSISQEKPNTFSVEVNLLQLESAPLFHQPVIDPRRKSYIQFMEIKDGKSKIGEFNISCMGEITASFNGLILLENKLKRGRLVVMNPVTRKLTELPLGTLSQPHQESYGFALSYSTSEYKVVHLFHDELRYINCEILNVGTRTWRPVNGPSFGLISWFGYKPVSAMGALHWVPHINDNDYIVSLHLENEKFHTVQLPKSYRTHDGIVEMGGSLCFVSHDEEMLQIGIWSLKGLSGEGWTKQHCITTGCILDMVPLFSMRTTEEMVFKRDEDGSLYAYDFQLQVMRKIDMETPLSDCYLPHVNSLVSWCPKDSSEDGNY